MQLCVKMLAVFDVAVIVSIVFGVPTIKRERESYLSRTLQSLIDSLNEDEKLDCLIVVMICEVLDDLHCFLSVLFTAVYSHAVRSRLLYNSNSADNF